MNYQVGKTVFYDKMRLVVVGDVHATVEDLDDADALMRLVLKTADDLGASAILFLGDLHHNFAITNVKVTAFYQKWFSAMAMYPIFALRGNHDMAGDGSDYHALISYDNITAITEPYMMGPAMAIPYMADPNLFVKACKEGTDRGAKLIFCHQEFNGAKYDNGMFIPHGADPSLVQAQFISGHIHTPQEFGNVWYVGAPRWRTNSDANVDRAIHVLDIVNGVVIRRQAIDTGSHCKTKQRFWLRSDKDELPVLDPKNDVFVSIEGDAAFCEKQAKRLDEKYPWVKYATLVQGKAIRVKESEGVPVAFGKFTKAYVPKYGTDSTILEKMAAERVWKS